jgi:hypothetical protein
LAYKKIFRALQNMIRRQSLSAPVIRVANAGWTLEQLRERARRSLVEYGVGVFCRSCSRLLSPGSTSMLEKV